MQYNTMGQRFKHAMYLIKTKPKKIMWLIFLGMLASIIIMEACRSFPLLAVPVTYGISAGIALIGLKTVRNEDPEAKDIFAAFKDLKTVKRVIGGQLWTFLILSIWMVVPAAVSLVSVYGLGYGAIMYGSIGIEDFSYFYDISDFARYGIYLAFAGIVTWVFSIIFIVKTFEVAFVPYILITREDVSPFDAWKESKKLTYGLKGRMFGFAVLPALVIGVIVGILGGLSMIPYVGSVFLIAAMVVLLFALVFLPYFYNLGLAGFYEASLHAPKVVYEYQQYGQQGYAAAYAEPTAQPESQPTVSEEPAAEVNENDDSENDNDVQTPTAEEEPQGDDNEK